QTPSTSTPPWLTARFFSMTPRPPRSTPFPYTTLFRSAVRDRRSSHACHDLAVDDRQAIARIVLQPHRLLAAVVAVGHVVTDGPVDRKSTRLNSSHVKISYAVFCLKKKSNITSITLIS